MFMFLPVGEVDVDWLAVDDIIVALQPIS